MNDDDEIQSTISGGGPTIGIPAELAALWRGTSPPIGAVVPPNWQWGQPGGPECDYDRACDKIEHRISTPYGGFGSVPVGDGIALIFEREIASYWLPTSDGGVVIRNPELSTIGDARKLVDAITAWTPWPNTITLTDGHMFFFDSAYEGEADPAAFHDGSALIVEAPGPGRYAIATFTDADENDYIKLTRVTSS